MWFIIRDIYKVFHFESYLLGPARLVIISFFCYFFNSNSFKNWGDRQYIKKVGQVSGFIFFIF